jgi:hypothetical protein
VTLAGPAAALLQLRDGRVLVAERSGADSASCLVELVDPLSLAVNRVAITITSAFGAMALNLEAPVLLDDGSVLFLGCAQNPGSDLTGLVQLGGVNCLFDPASLTYSFVPIPFSLAGAISAVKLLDGRILAVGGNVTLPGWDNAAFLFDQGGRFLGVSWLQLPHPLASLTLMADGKVAVSGGEAVGGSTSVAGTAEVELIDPATLSSVIAHGHYLHFQSGTGLDKDGRLLFMGGAPEGAAGGSGWNPGVEAFDGISFRTLPQLIFSGSGFTPVLLDSGKLFVTGIGRELALTDAIELYDPALAGRGPWPGPGAAGPAILQQPQRSQMVTEPDGFALSVAASSAVGLVSYQWQRYDSDGFSDLPGETGPVLTVAASTGPGGVYRCLASDAAGSASSWWSAVAVRPQAAPVRLSQVFQVSGPTTVALAGGRVKLSNWQAFDAAVQVEAGDGYPAPFWSWQMNGAMLPGTWMASYLNVAEAGVYRVMYYDRSGQPAVASTAITVTP